MRLFRWLAAGPIPPGIDLRRCGWQLTCPEATSGEEYPVPALSHADQPGGLHWSAIGDWRFQPLRRLLLLIGVNDEEARARMLRLGFGDVLGSRTSLHEVEARALRVAEQANVLPRHRDIGELRLDLFARDGFVGKRPLGLHPREFALIWRLAEAQGAAVAKKALVRDVWRMAHVPDTNSLAVHVFRLRAKLAVAGLAELVCTAPSGGYFIAQTGLPTPIAPFMLAETDGQEVAAMAMSVEQSFPWEPMS